MIVDALTESRAYQRARHAPDCNRLIAVRSGLDTLWNEFGTWCQDCTVFLSISDLSYRAQVICASGSGPEEAWGGIVGQLDSLDIRITPDTHLKLDLVTERYPTTWHRLRANLAVTKRNYFRFGLSIGDAFQYAFLEQELNANAMLYGGNDVESASLNEGNFRYYFREKFGDDSILSFSDNETLEIFVTEAFYTASGETMLRMESKGLGAGHRVVDQLDVPLLDEMIKSATRHLQRQLDKSGRFIYGRFPCFNRLVAGYNTLRHASSTYAMVEAYEILQDDELLSDITRSLDYLCRVYVKEFVCNEEKVAFLIEEAGEIKLGGSAALLLALTKYTDATGELKYLALMEKLAAGIVSFQQDDGGFDHVLTFPSLQLKEKFRVVYYDGEAVFALACYYRISGNKRYREVIERAFSWFESQNYKRFHDHWIAYACEVMYNLTRDDRYYALAYANVEGYLDFVENRMTAFPTLLELICSTERLFRSRDSLKPDSFKEIGRGKFLAAIDARAQKMAHGYFWPELAMYFKVPQEVCGAFFIRHHSFRVRIDDVEHFLSGFIGYRKFLSKKFSLDVNRISI